MKRMFLFVTFGIFLLNLPVFSEVLLADQEMKVHRLNEDGTVDSWTEWIPFNANVNSQKALVNSASDTIVEYIPELIVTSIDIKKNRSFDPWDAWNEPACSLNPVSCAAVCGGPTGLSDFDQAWGPLSAPSDLKIVVGWKPNGCVATDGTLNFYIVPDGCEGEDILIYTVTKEDLGDDYVNFSYSPEIDISPHLNSEQVYYIRIVEQDDFGCGGLDYHISAIGVFTKTSKISGFIESNNSILQYKEVILQQRGIQKGVTDGEGLYEFNNVNPDETFRIVFKGALIKAIDISASDISGSNISGCIFNGESTLGEKEIILRQKGLMLQAVTDTDGCYQFDNVNPDETFKIIIKGK